MLTPVAAGLVSLVGAVTVATAVAPPPVTMASLLLDPSGLPRLGTVAPATLHMPTRGLLASNATNLTLTLEELLLFGRSNGTTVAPATVDNDIIFSNKLVQIVFCVLYSSIFVLGVFGNVLVCYVVFRNKAMQTVTNLFITNLALSDILLCVLAVPFTPSYTFMRRWVFGKLLCHTVPLAQGCSVYISTLTLTSIAIDRFFVIIYPFHPRMKLSTCITIIVLIWSFAIMVTMPYGLYMRLHGVTANGTEANTTTSALSSAMYCEELWPSEEMRKTFSIVTSILQFVLPFIIMAFCYVCVSIRLNDRARTKPGSKTSRREEADRDRKKRTNRMLISMVAIFGISWLPLNVVNMCNDFNSDINSWRFYNLIFFIAHLTAMSSTCYNPFLYAWLNDNFRKEFKQVLPCFDPSRGRAGTVGGNRGAGGGGWRSERTCNGNNDTVQETLIASSQVLPSSRSSQPQQQTHQLSSSSSQGHGNQPMVDSILLSEVVPPIPQLPPPLGSNMLPSVQSAETVILPSGVLETPFDVQLVPGASPTPITNGMSDATNASVRNGLSYATTNPKLSSLILINDGTTADSKVPAIL